MTLFNKIKQKIYFGFLKFLKYPFRGFYYKKLARLTDMDIMPENANYFLGMVAIFKGEDDYLREWIEFHKMMGVEHFILYDNGLEPSSEKLLDPYVKAGLVTHIPFPDPNVKFGKYADAFTTQQLAYGDCIKRFKHHFNYLLRIDIDEFMFPKEHDSITDILKSFKENEIKGIEVNWLSFGYNNHENKPDGLVIDNFTYSSSKISNQSVKSICNTKYLSNFLKYTNAHHFSYRFSIIDILSKLIKNSPRLVKGREANEILQLNHYRTKSKEEYLKKGRINKGGWMTGKEIEENFWKLNENINEVDNQQILRFLPKLKETLNEV